MSRYIKGESREQLSLEPMCLDDMIGEENPVRAIEMIVESMGIGSLGFEYGEKKKRERSRIIRKICSSCMRIRITMEYGHRGR